MLIQQKYLRPLAYAGADCVGDLDFAVTHLPSSGVVLKADRLTQVNLGEPLTAAEVATWSFARSGEEHLWNGSVIGVPRNCGRVPIPLLANVPANLVADTSVTLTELPSNGSVFLTGGFIPVVCGQTINAAQLGGLTFAPAA